MIVGLACVSFCLIIWLLHTPNILAYTVPSALFKNDIEESRINASLI